MCVLDVVVMFAWDIKGDVSILREFMFRITLENFLLRYYKCVMVPPILIMIG